MVNLKVRFRNPVFWAQIFLIIISTIMAYKGISGADVTTWGKLGELLKGAIMNPYCVWLIVLNIWNAANDPTTQGLGDSNLALTYDKPKPKGE